MRRFLGAAIILLGVVLLMFGLDASDSLGSRLSKLFTGSPTDKSVWLLIGGGGAVLVGVWMACSRGGRRS